MCILSSASLWSKRKIFLTSFNGTTLLHDNKAENTGRYTDIGRCFLSKSFCLRSVEIYLIDDWQAYKKKKLFNRLAFIYSFLTKDWLANKRTLIFIVRLVFFFVYAKMRMKGTARRQTRYDDLSDTLLFSFSVCRIIISQLNAKSSFIWLTFSLNLLKQRQTVTYRYVSKYETFVFSHWIFSWLLWSEDVCVSEVKKRNICNHLISYLSRHLHRRR